MCHGETYCGCWSPENGPLLPYVAKSLVHRFRTWKKIVYVIHSALLRVYRKESCSLYGRGDGPSLGVLALARRHVGRETDGVGH